MTKSRNPWKEKRRIDLAARKREGLIAAIVPPRGYVRGGLVWRDGAMHVVLCAKGKKHKYIKV